MQADILHLALTCRELSEVGLAAAYNAPRFGNRRLSPLLAFQKFLKMDPAYGAHVRVLKLTDVKESLFDAVDENWLYTILVNCLLEELHLRGSAFLTDKTLMGLSNVACPTLKLLDISQTENISADGIIKLVSMFSYLETLNIEECRGISDQTLKMISEWSPLLKTLRLKDASITDAAFTLAPHCLNLWQRLESVSLKACARIGDQAVLSLCLHCPDLKSLSLQNCLKLTNVSIHHLASKPFAHIDFRGCRFQNLPLSVLDQLLSSSATTLRSLAMSYKLLDQHRTVKFEIEDTFRKLQSLEILTFEDIDEKTPHNIINSLASRWVPTLRWMYLYRVTYTTDWIATGMYTTVESQPLVIDHAFVNRFNQVYGKRCKMILKSQG
ncbi:hypothetical protein HDU67_009693 [Dinochytrium kinnereticum]|nr:hypothetical protein HDU67_009693 [Dinochytrium kinnereticum]